MKKKKTFYSQSHRISIDINKLSICLPLTCSLYSYTNPFLYIQFHSSISMHKRAHVTCGIRQIDFFFVRSSRETIGTWRLLIFHSKVRVSPTLLYTAMHMRASAHLYIYTTDALSFSRMAARVFTSHDRGGATLVLFHIRRESRRAT